MEYTLFGGVIETKKEARERASQIADCLTIIETAPEERRCIASQWHAATYFINKAKAHQLDPNDHDGILRRYGTLDEAADLTKQDRRAMDRNPKIWKPYTGHWSHWPGVLPSSRYCVTLHPKEIAVLEEIKEECINQLGIIRDGVRYARRRLIELRAVDADLPADIAARFHLTTKGERTK